MKILQVRMQSPRPVETGRFYAGLGLPVEHGSTSTRVRIGRSVLILTLGPDSSGAHHLALTVPADVLPGARDRLRTLVPLRTRDGVDRFHFDPPFGPADSVYADDPGGTLLELIGRDRPHPFDDVDLARDVLGIGEVAVPVESVPAAVLRLREERGLRALLEGPEFAAVGDHDGMIVLVTAGRTWFPTTDRWPDLTALQVDIDAEGPPLLFSYGTVLT